MLFYAKTCKINDAQTRLQISRLVFPSTFFEKKPRRLHFWNEFQPLLRQSMATFELLVWPNGGSPCLDVLIYFRKGIVPIIVPTNTLPVASPVGIMSNSTGSPAAAAVRGSKILSFLAKKVLS